MLTTNTIFQYPQNLNNVVQLVGTILLVFIEFVYIFFAFLLTRQIRLMNKSFATPMGVLFTLIGRLHFFISLMVTFITVLVLL